MHETRRTARSLRTDSGALLNLYVAALVMLFAVISIALIAVGAQAYRSIDDAVERHAQQRTAVGYVLNRVRANDASGAIRVERTSLEGEVIDVLVIEQTFDGDIYETRVFCCGGELREQFVGKEIPLERAADGEIIARLSGMEIALVGGDMLRFDFTYEDGGSERMYAALHSDDGGERREESV